MPYCSYNGDSNGIVLLVLPTSSIFMLSVTSISVLIVIVIVIMVTLLMILSVLLFLTDRY